MLWAHLLVADLIDSTSTTTSTFTSTFNTSFNNISKLLYQSLNGWYLHSILMIYSRFIQDLSRIYAKGSRQGNSLSNLDSLDSLDNWYLGGKATLRLIIGSIVGLG